MAELPHSAFERIMKCIKSEAPVEARIEGGRVLLDRRDLDILSLARWGVGSGGYARAKIDGRFVLMHRLITRPPPEMVVDHVDRNKLNNCRDNLRVCTRAENSRNLASRGGVSRFRGVIEEFRMCGPCKWRAVITVNYKPIQLGLFDTEVEAALAYDEAALRHHGEFAATNRSLGLL